LTAAVALVTARAARGRDDDMPPLLAAFAAAGARAEIFDWDDPDVDWARFDLVLLRSAWDYTERLRQFLAWVGHTAARTLLLNPEPAVRWSADKHYLQTLAAAGLPIVDTVFAEPGSSAREALQKFLARHPCEELVVKPTVGAGARDTRRHASAATAEILGHMEELLGEQRSLMVQPYYQGVDTHGETALIYIAGRFSHAIRKGPLLPAGAPASAALFAPEQITARVPGADELAAGEQVMAQLRGFGELLYARVDLIRDEHGHPCLLELELAEPSLFFSFAPGTAERFAAAALARLAEGARR
jgi:hypothetical protein